MTRGLGTTPIGNSGSYVERDMLDSEIAGQPARNHSNHLLPSTWAPDDAGYGACSPVEFGHCRLFTTLANDIKEAVEP